MKNQKVQFFVTLITCMLFSGLVSVAASGHLFDSNEVVYDNTNSGMSSTNVKAAVDELYAAASDYSNISTRVTNLESNYNKYFTDNPKVEFRGGSGYNWVFTTSDPGKDAGFGVFDSNGARKSDFYYNPGDGSTIISARSTGNVGSGILNLKGTPVQINNVDVSTSSTGNLTIDTSNTRTATSTLAYIHRWGKLVVISLNDVCPKSNATNGFHTFIKGIPESVGVVNVNLPSNTDPSTVAYRVRVSGTNLQWSYSGGSDNCAFAAGEVVYVAK